MDNKIYDVIIVGAGISGISAARLLHSKGYDVLLLDKGRGIGGRMATRRVNVDGEDVYYDYGVQSFSVKLTPVKDILHSTKIDRSMTLWPYEKTINCLYIRGGIRLMPKILAKDLKILKAAKVESINYYHDWEIITEAGDTFHSRYVIVTAPAPQSLELINSGNAQLSNSQLFKLDSITYTSNLVILIRLNDRVDLTTRKPESDIIEIIVNNEDKGIKQKFQTLTVIFKSGYSSKFYNKPEIEHLWNFLEEFKEIRRDNVAEFNVHRWKYSQPENYIEREAFIKGKSGIYLCGDYFFGNNCSNVELAIYSGLEAANDIIKNF